VFGVRTFNNPGMRGFGSFGGIWEDTQLWVLDTLPSWLTGATAVDVSPGPAGVEELRAMAPELDGKKVVLSARAQMAYWALLEEEAAEIDALFAETADIGGADGEEIRLRLEAARMDLVDRANAMVASNVEAQRQGVPVAVADDWYPPGTERTGSISERTGAPAAGATLTNPAIWLIVGAAVVVIVAVAVGTAIYVTINNKYGLEEMRLGIESLKAGGATPEQISRFLLSKIQSEEPKGKFPWGWVVGVGSAALGVIFLVAWAEGSLQRWTSRLRGGTTRTW
jgi:hypothetical protein